MATTCLYENETDHKQHSRAIEMLGRELHIPEEEIQTLYETMLCSLREKARIKDYLVILVSRVVKDMVRGNTRSRT